MKPLVTIGIPIYNAERFLADAIRSVINQSFQDWELLLTDDGCKDKSIEIAKQFLPDKRITLIVDGENKGLPFRLNQQIGLAKGKYFARMDADDIMHPERLAQQVAFLESNPHTDVVGTSAYSIDMQNKIQGVLGTNPHPCALSDVFSHKCFLHPSVMAKLDWLKDNLYDSKYVRMEDLELWARTIQQSKFDNLSTPLLFYRDVGVPNLKKYLQSAKGSRLLVRSIFPNFLSTQKWLLLLKSYAKSLVYIVFTILQQQDFLIKRRARSIDDIEKQNTTSILSKAISMTVGGK